MTKNILTSESGSVAVEFSILALPFFLTVFTILFVVYHSLVQSELDRAAGSIASQIAIQANQSPTSADFLSAGTCSQHIGPLLDCGRLSLGATKVTGRLLDYRNKLIGGSTWSLGCAGDTVLVELSYPVASFITPVVIADVIEVGEQKVYRSRAVIRREPIITG
ncbi:MAG: hypothetical protein Q8S27_20700, partial [Hoeflea sp.]|nr:hypothetical protein [Hoeflea sp.]